MEILQEVNEVCSAPTISVIEWALKHRTLVLNPNFIQRMGCCLASLSFLGGSDRKESACNAGNLDSVRESGRSLGEQNGYPLQYSCLKYPMDRGAWKATVREFPEWDTT